jgi:hypothetical protein
VLAIDVRPGRPTLSITRLPSGSLELTVAGHGQGLLSAARMLSSDWMQTLHGTSATVTRQIGTRRTAAPAPGYETMAQATATGTRALKLTSTFNLPVDQVVARGQAVLRVGVNFDAPNGGRVRIALNGNTLGAYNASPQGGTLHTAKFKLSSNWTENGNLIPGYFLQPGRNRVTITAVQAGGRGSHASVAHLSVEPGSGLSLSTQPRPVTEQLGLWPFPFYGAQAWSRTTVAMPAGTSRDALSALIAALANAERITGVPTDPAFTLHPPTAAQDAGNLIVVGNPGFAALPYPGPFTDGVLAETHINYGGTALIAGGYGLLALGQGYQPNMVDARAVLIQGHHFRVLQSAPVTTTFGTPTRAWLLPAALLAVLVLGWVALQIARSRRRLIDMPDLKPGEVTR